MEAIACAFLPFAPAPRARSTIFILQLIGARKIKVQRNDNMEASSLETHIINYYSDS